MIPEGTSHIPHRHFVSSKDWRVPPIPLSAAPHRWSSLIDSKLSLFLKIKLLTCAVIPMTSFRRLGKFLGLSRAQWTIHVKNRNWTIRARRIKHQQRDVDVKRHRGKSSGFPTFQTLWPSFSIYQAEPDHRGTVRHDPTGISLTP